MPSGKTHDRITWLLTPLLALMGWLFTQRLDLVALLSASFLFAGLMFSGDLDLKSVQYKRWGFLRWIWLPYQKWIPHRSPLSHGPVLGTLARLIYLTAIVLLGSALMGWGLSQLGQQQVLQQTRSGLQYVLSGLYLRPEWVLILLCGLWLGALSHTWADELSSAWKRWRRRRSKPLRKRNRTLKK